MDATLTRATAAGGRANPRTAPDRLLTSITIRPPTDSNLPCADQLGATGLAHSCPRNLFLTVPPVPLVRAEGAALIGSEPSRAVGQIGRALVLSRSQDGALLLGRLFVAALFLPSGLNKLVAFSGFAASLGAKGVPYPALVAAVVVAAEVLGPLALIIGLWPRWTALVLIGFTAVTALADAPPCRGRCGVPASAERRDPGKPGHHWRPAVLLCRRAGKLEPGQPAGTADQRSRP